jgi:hypothetical protein
MSFSKATFSTRCHCAERPIFNCYSECRYAECRFTECSVIVSGAPEIEKIGLSFFSVFEMVLIEPAAAKSSHLFLRFLKQRNFFPPGGGGEGGGGGGGGG